MTDGELGAQLDAVEALLADEEWSAALEALGDLRRRWPTSADVWRMQARALAGAGELQEAQYATDRWVALAPRSPAALRFKSDLLFDRGKHYAAAEVAAELSQLVPDDADAWLVQAGRFRSAGLVPRARAAVKRAIELDPSAASFALAGEIELAAREPSAAASYFREALGRDPDNGSLAQQLQRALGVEQQKAADAKTETSRAKAAGRARAREVEADEKAARKRARALQVELGGGATTPRVRYGWWSGLALAMVVVAGVFAFVRRPEDTRPPAGDGAAPKSRIQAGDCVTWNPGEAFVVRTVRCDEPHFMQIAGVVDVGERFTEYPGAIERQEVIETDCPPPIRSLMGGAMEPFGRFVPAVLAPSAAGWSAGDRAVWCGVQLRRSPGTDAPPAFTGLARASDQRLAFAPGTCLDLSFAQVLCDRSHSFEVAGSVEVGAASRPPGTDPADPGWSALLAGPCSDKARQYLGRDLDASLHVEWIPMGEAASDGGANRTECLLVGGPAGSRTLVDHPFRV